MDPLIADEKDPEASYGAVSDDEETAASNDAPAAVSEGGDVLFDATGKPEAPRPGFMVTVFTFIEAVGVIDSLCLLATQVIPMFIIPLHKLGWINVILKFYISLFCVLFIIIESSAPIPFIRGSKFLRRFFSRGACGATRGVWPFAAL